MNSLEAMKMALEEMEYARANRVPNMGAAINALRQAIEQAEKQEPFIYVREVNERLFGGYEHCSESDAGAFPVYTAPVDAVNMNQERVDETAKGEHEPWCDSVTKLLLSMPPQIPPCNCKPKREWVGLTDDEVLECFDSVALGAVEKENVIDKRVNIFNAIKAIEAKLKEKNT